MIGTQGAEGHRQLGGLLSSTRFFGFAHRESGASLEQEQANEAEEDGRR
jgi:hypothetical protein